MPAKLDQTDEFKILPKVNSKQAKCQFGQRDQTGIDLEGKESSSQCWHLTLETSSSLLLDSSVFGIDVTVSAVADLIKLCEHHNNNNVKPFEHHNNNVELCEHHNNNNNV